MKYSSPILGALVGLLLSSGVRAQTAPPVPDRQIPPGVLAELRLLDNRFESALAQDCAPERCFSKGCSYGEHTVADRPRSGALPGLAEEEGPGSGPRQEYLTLARCAFAHERSLKSADARALVRRLRTKLSTGWTVVEVSHQRLPPIPAELREAPEAPKEPEPPPAPEPPEPVAQPEPEVWQLHVAVRELWLSLLPHFSWMIAVVMVTFAALLLIWGWRRLGRLSPEEQIMLSQMSAAPPESEAGEDPGPQAAPEADSAEEESFVSQQKAYWAQRFAAEEQPDADTRALVSQWLRSDSMGLLAKATLTYPKVMPDAFPEGGDFADSKLRFSEYLRDVSQEDLPSDEEFYGQLKQHALSASLARQPDAKGMANLRADFGAAGLVQLMSNLPPRYGALLFAHATIDDQLEGARLMSSAVRADVAEQLLQSNRMAKAEADYLVQLLAACNEDAALPAPPHRPEVSGLGRTFDAAGSLSVLLPMVQPEERSALLTQAKARFSGAFPGWFGEILFADLLLQLDPEARADVFLQAEVRNLAGWLSLLPDEARTGLEQSMPSSLRNAVAASAAFNSRAEQLRRYASGRREVASAFQRRIARDGLPFESVMR